MPVGLSDGRDGNQVRFAATNTLVPILAEATHTQFLAFQFLNTTISLTPALKPIYTVVNATRGRRVPGCLRCRIGTAVSGGDAVVAQ